MKMNIKSVIAGIGMALCLVGATSAKAATIAYEVPAGTVGNQSFTGILGMDFVVNSAINVLSLGAFDDTRNGLNGISAGTTLTTELWSRNGNNGVAILASETFTSTSEGTLIGSSRFKALASALILNPGEYAIVGYGYNSNDQNGNKGSVAGTWFTNDGGGLLSFVGGGRFQVGGLGTSIGNTIDGGPADRYAAGTFEFEAVSPIPIPATLPLLMGALGLIGLLGRRRRKVA